jgi:hypothetical protein
MERQWKRFSSIRKALLIGLYNSVFSTTVSDIKLNSVGQMVEVSTSIFNNYKHNHYNSKRDKVLDNYKQFIGHN